MFPFFVSIPYISSPIPHCLPLLLIPPIPASVCSLGLSVKPLFYILVSPFILFINFAFVSHVTDFFCLRKRSM